MGKLGRFKQWVYIYLHFKKKKLFCAVLCGAVFVDIMVDLDIQILRKAEHLVKLLLCVNLNWGDSNNGCLRFTNIEKS